MISQNKIKIFNTSDAIAARAMWVSGEMPESPFNESDYTKVSAMSNIVFLKFPLRVPDPVLDDATDELAQLIQNSGLLNIIGELEAKLGIMLCYLTEIRDIADAEIERENISITCL